MCAAPAQRTATRAGGCTRWWLVGACAAAAAAALLSSWLHQPEEPEEPKEPETLFQRWNYGRQETVAVAECSPSYATSTAAGAALVLVLQWLYRLLRKWTSRPRDAVKEPSSIDPYKYMAIQLRYLLQSERCADVTLSVGDRQLKAHRAVLQARCPKLFDMAVDDSPEADGCRIAVKDVEPDVLGHLLVYLYAAEVQLDSLLAQKLLVAADQYGVIDLREQCEAFLSKNLTVENVAVCAVLSIQHCCPRLQEAATRFIAGHFKGVMDTTGWSEAVRKHPNAVVVIDRKVGEAFQRTRWF